MSYQRAVQQKELHQLRFNSGLLKKITVDKLITLIDSTRIMNKMLVVSVFEVAACSDKKKRPAHQHGQFFQYDSCSSFYKGRIYNDDTRI